MEHETRIREHDPLYVYAVLCVLCYLTLFFLLLPSPAGAVCCKCYKGERTATNSFCVNGETTIPCGSLVSGATQFTNLRESSPDLLADVTCEGNALSNEACQEIGSTDSSASAICRTVGPLTNDGVRTALESFTQTPPASESGTPSIANEQPFSSITPDLGVKIPGLQLSPATKQDETVRVPFLAEYINAIYRYVIGIIMIAATVMVVYGGFRYLLGSAMDDVQKGKTIIRDAIIGMVLAIGAYTILNTINPETVSLRTLELSYVEQVDEPVEIIDSADYQSATGELPPDRAAVREIVRQVAAENNIDPCALEAVAAGESGFRTDTIGYDANVPREGVGSRIRFILGGRKYSGQTFDVPAGAPQIREGECPSASAGELSAQLSPAQLELIRNRGVRNNDRFNPNAPPDFGLDTRFSVGFGMGGTTILTGDNCQMNRCENGYIGQTVGGRCYTALELIEPRVQAETMVAIYNRNVRGCDSYRNPIARQRCIFARYIGQGCSARFGSCKRMQRYAECSGNSQTAARERPDCNVWKAGGETRENCNDFNRD